MENLEIYEKVRKVPEEAKKEISAGRLKGMTDINPMWRIKALTEIFGPCGLGWKYKITSQWLESGADGVVSAFCNIDLQYCYEGKWSEPVPGTGGSAFISKERSGMYTSDECYKQALTDAISVAAKALGVGADVYWAKDRTKYTNPDEGVAECPVCHKIQNPVKKVENGKQVVVSGADIIAGCGGKCWSCYQKEKAHDAV